MHFWSPVRLKSFECLLSMYNILLWIAFWNPLLVFPLKSLLTVGTVCMRNIYPSVICLWTLLWCLLLFYVNMPSCLFPEFNVLLKMFCRIFVAEVFIFHSFRVYFLVWYEAGTWSFFTGWKEKKSQYHLLNNLSSSHWSRNTAYETFSLWKLVWSLTFINHNGTYSDHDFAVTV